MDTKSGETLTALQQARVQKFTSGMDAETASAMKMLFEYTKKGCDKFAYQLFEVVHFGGSMSQATIATFAPMGILNPNGSIPSGVREAIKKAVAEGYLEMHTD